MKINKIKKGRSLFGHPLLRYKGGNCVSKEIDWRKSVVYQIYPKSFNDTTGMV
ncbi:hypothetical protein ACVQ92_08345 [Staphylococcus aureus]